MAPKHPANLPLSLTYTHDHSCCMGGIPLSELVAQFGTPLYVIDQATIEANCRKYTDTLRTHYPNSQVYYAAKANINVGMLDLIGRQGLGVDVVSLGELYTALQSQIDPTNMLLHGNNKSDEELRLAIEKNVCIVIDNEDDVSQIQSLLDTTQKARVFTPIHTNISSRVMPTLNLA